MVDQTLAHITAAEDHRREARRDVAEPRRRALEEGLHRQRRERGLLGGLPDNRVAAHQGQGGVPRPDGDREVEGADHAHDAERMPGLHHSVLGPFRGDGQAEQLARQPDSVVADVDHFLHLALGFGDDLSGFKRDQHRKFGLGGAKLFAQQAHQLTPPRGGQVAPGEIGCAGRLDRAGDVDWRGILHIGDGLAGDGRAHRPGAADPLRALHAQTVQDVGRLGCGGGGLARQGHGPIRRRAAIDRAQRRSVRSGSPGRRPREYPPGE